MIKLCYLALRCPWSASFWFFVSIFIKIIFRIYKNETTYQCWGSGMFIPDPEYEFFHPGSTVKKVSYPGSASKNLSIINQNNSFQTRGNMTRDVHCGSRIHILIFYPSRIVSDPGSTGQTGTRSVNRIRNTDTYNSGSGTFQSSVIGSLLQYVILDFPNTQCCGSRMIYFDLDPTLWIIPDPDSELSRKPGIVHQMAAIMTLFFIQF